MIQRGLAAAALLQLLIAMIAALSLVTTAYCAGDADGTHIILLKSPSPAATSSGTVAAMMMMQRGAVRQQSNAIATRVLGGTGKIIAHYSTVPGFAAGPLTTTEVAALKQDKRVLGVFPNEVKKVQIPTAAAVAEVIGSTEGFLGLDGPNGAWAKLGGVENAGEGIVIGFIGVGIWPEAPSFSDRANPSTNSGEVVYGPAPSSFKGTCNLETGCNRKLIGCQSFWKGAFPDSKPTDKYPKEDLSCRWSFADSVGTYTTGIAAGNAAVVVNGTGHEVQISGVAPRARISTYKVVWGTPQSADASTVDYLSAIDAAVLDGCQIIMSGYAETLVPGKVFGANPVQMAYKNAAAAGVSVVSLAGNFGPDIGSVNVDSGNVGPWQLTVAASNDWRKAVANLTLGDGRVYTGYAVGAFTGGYSPLSNVSLVMGLNVGLPGLGDQSSYCRPGSLDPAKVAGKIVLCWQGGAFDYQKTAEIMAAGGVGMVLDAVPGSAEATYDSLSAGGPIPALWVLDGAVLQALEAYASSPEATASFSPFTVSYDEAAPRVIRNSARGPVLGEPDLLKPDIAAPGWGIVGPSSPQLPLWQFSVTQAAAAAMAGIAALIKQAHPSWSPMAIKSALMTTSYLTTKTTGNSTQLATTTPFSVGAGFVDATPALNPGLVFDSNDKDMNRFICGVDGLLADAAAVTKTCPDCATDPAACEPVNLNQASILVARVVGVQVVRRTVTSVLSERADFDISRLDAPPGFEVSVSPAVFSLDPGASQALTITINSATDAVAKHPGYQFGSLTWSSSQGSLTRMPLVMTAAYIKKPTEIRVPPPRTRSLSWSVTPGWTGTLSSLAVGLEPAKVFTGTVFQDPDQIIDTKNASARTELGFKVEVPPGTKWSYLRVATFDADVPSGTDFDLYVFDDKEKLVATGINGFGAQEEANIENPTSRWYTVFLLGYSVRPEGVNAKLHVWLLRSQPSPGSSNSRASPSASKALAVTAGQPVPISLTFNSRLMSESQRWLGLVMYAGKGIPDDQLKTLIYLY